MAGSLLYIGGTPHGELTMFIVLILNRWHIRMLGNDTMATLFQHAAESGLEWIAMGDWNTKPEEMQATEWCCKKRIHVRSAAEPTWHPSAGGLFQV